jgi:hypothetical protein
MIPRRPHILLDLPPAVEKRLKLIEALARHTAQDPRAALLNAPSSPPLRETFPELAALWQWLILKYSPDQPRVPAGSAEGGQWTSGEGGSAEPVASARPTNSVVRPIADRPVQLASLETGTMTDATPPPTDGQSKPGLHPNVQVASGLTCDGFPSGCQNGGTYGTSGQFNINGRILCIDCAIKFFGLQGDSHSERERILGRFRIGK